MQTAEVIEAPTLEPIIRALNRISDELESIVEHSREESEPAHELASATKHFATLLINHSFDELPDILKGIVDDLQHIAPSGFSDDISAMVRALRRISHQPNLRMDSDYARTHRGSSQRRRLK